jgi:hypothetical protein
MFWSSHILCEFVSQSRTQTFKIMFISVFSCQRIGSQERSYTPVFPWISLSIHPGGMKWIIIFGKDFDRPGWIKEVPPYLQLCRRATMILKSKVLLLHDLSVLLRVTHLKRVPRHGIKGNATACYLIHSYFCQVRNHCLPKLKLPLFPPLPWCVPCSPSQYMFTNTPSMSWPWDARSSWRSIFLELFHLSFRATEQHRQMKKVKFRVVVDQPLQERRSPWGLQDRWRLVWPLFPPLLY